MTKPKKAKYITRTEAAEILEVHPQSITNYAERGFLRTVRAKTNDFTYYIREEVEALKPEISDLIDKEKAISEFRETLEKERQSLSDAVEEQRRLLVYKTQCVKYTKQLIEDCYCLMGSTEDCEPVRILLQILMGENVHDVEEQTGHSWFMLSKICRNALNTLRRLPDYEEMCRQKDKALSDYNNMAASYERLSEQYELLKILYQEAKGIRKEDVNSPP